MPSVKTFWFRKYTHTVRENDIKRNRSNIVTKLSSNENRNSESLKKHESIK